jgi:hypothetical protein
MIEQAMDLNINLKGVDLAVEMKKKKISDKIILFVLSEKIILSKPQIEEIVRYTSKGYSNEVIIKSLSNHERDSPVPAAVTKEIAFVKLLTEVKKYLEKHEWKEFTKKCWSNNYYAQVGQNEEGQSIEQYISETIGSNIENDIPINQIKEISYEYSTVVYGINEDINMVKQIPTYTIVGKVILKNNEVRILRMMVIETYTGIYQITGGWG